MKNTNVDFYTANNDFSGERVMDDNHEIVEHQANCAIRIWCNNQNTDFPTHWHSDLEIIVPSENYYDAVVDGEAFHVMPGDILVIPSGALHFLKAPDTGVRFIFLFDISAFTHIHSFKEISTLISSPLHITKAAFPQIYTEAQQCLLQMRAEYFEKKPFYELTVFSLLMNLFVMLGRNHLRSIHSLFNVRESKQQEYMTKFDSVMEYFDEHCTEDICLDDAAAAAGFSKYHFSRLFKQYTGYTFGTYICRRRIMAAERLLEQPDLSITEIAMRSGFPSISTFNRIFRQQKNCSPTEYRLKNNTLRQLCAICGEPDASAAEQQHS